MEVYSETRPTEPHESSHSQAITKQKNAVNKLPQLPSDYGQAQLPSDYGLAQLSHGTRKFTKPFVLLC